MGDLARPPGISLVAGLYVEWQAQCRRIQGIDVQSCDGVGSDRSAAILGVANNLKVYFQVSAGVRATNTWITSR